MAKRRSGGSHSFKDGAIYLLSILVPLLSITWIMGCVTYLVYTTAMTRTFDKKLATILAITCAVAYFLVKGFRHVRVEFRQRAEADDPTKDPVNAYKYQSEKDRKMLDMVTFQLNEQALSDREFRTMLRDVSKNPQKDLQSLIGMKDAKEKIVELEANMKYSKGKHEDKPFNVALIGNPGTGKTTIVSVMAAYLKKYKYTKADQYVCVDGTTLVSSPDPIRRTSLLLRRSKGRLLFIDEAYSIAYGGSMGNSVLTLILDEMESDRANTFVALAGYRDEMKKLFGMNPGLQSRIGSIIFFEDYTDLELMDILEGMLRKKGFTMTADAACAFAEILSRLRTQPSFANARSCRLLAEDAVSMHRVRMMRKEPDVQAKVIDEDDVVYHQDREEYFQDA